MTCMGFDVGFQTSTFAVPRAGGIEVLLNGYSKRQTPTQISFGQKQRALGEVAKQRAVTAFKNTIGAFKSLIGRSYHSPDVQEELAKSTCRHQAMEDGTVGFVVNHNGEDRVFSVTQLLAMYLGHLKECVDNELQAKTVDCVIGVPVYFNDAQRHALLDSCHIAGLNCLKVMNETTAVALNYGIYKQDLPAEGETPRRVVFFDCGHHAVQMSLVEIVKGKLSIIATSSICVGGRDFDDLLVQEMAKRFQEKTKVDITSKPRAMIRLLNECEKLKKQMSANSTSLPMNIECLYEERDLRDKIDRAEFEELCKPVFDKIEQAVDEFIQTILARDIALDDIFSIEVVGGSCRIPYLKTMLSEKFGKQLSTTLNCDEAVARGCALMAAILSPTFRVRDFKVTDATTYAINLTYKSPGKDDESVSEVYGVGSACNLSKILSFNRDQDFELEAKYTTPEQVPDKQSLIGIVRIKDVKPDADGNAQKVKVKVRMNTHGCFGVDYANLMEKVEIKEEEEPKPEASSDEPAPMETGADEAKNQEKLEEGSETPTEKPADNEEKKEAPTEEEKKEEEKKEEPKKKKAKTHKTTPLSFELYKPYMKTAQKLNELVETELELASQDRQEKEKNDARNALEEYIYDMREKVSTVYEEFIKPDDSDKFRSKLTQLEDWLYDEGEDQPKNVYVEKLQELQKTGDAVKFRADEYENRSAAEERLRHRIVHFRKFVDEQASGAEKYDHISNEDALKVSDQVNTTEAWLNETLQKQSSLSKHDDPVLTVADMDKKAKDLDRNCNPIVTKPKPKVDPPKEEEKKEEAKEEKKEAETDAKEDAPMDVDDEGKKEEPKQSEKKQEDVSMDVD